MSCPNRRLDDTSTVRASMAARMNTVTSPERPGTAAWRWIDRSLGIGLMTALIMVVVTAWPAAASAQRFEGNGDSATETRTLDSVSAVVTHSLKVEVRQGPSPQALVQADRNLLPLIETVVQDGPHGKTLVVRWKANTSIKPRTPPLVTVTMAMPERLAVEGSGDLIAEQLKLPRLTARIAGSGDLHLRQVQTDDLNIAVTGSGDVSASGQTARLSVRIAGSGDVHSNELRADDAQVEVVGSGNAQLQVQRRLTASIIGSGDIVYSGGAAVKSSVVGSGRVKAR